MTKTRLSEPETMMEPEMRRTGCNQNTGRSRKILVTAKGSRVLPCNTSSFTLHETTSVYNVVLFTIQSQHKNPSLEIMGKGVEVKF